MYILYIYIYIFAHKLTNGVVTGSALHVVFSLYLLLNQKTVIWIVHCLRDRLQVSLAILSNFKQIN